MTILSSISTAEEIKRETFDCSQEYSSLDLDAFISSNIKFLDLLSEYCSTTSRKLKAEFDSIYTINDSSKSRDEMKNLNNERLLRAYTKKSQITHTESIRNKIDSIRFKILAEKYRQMLDTVK